MGNVGRNKSYIGHVRRALADLKAKFGNRLVREICGQLALGASAGMRSSAIARIDYIEIDFKQGGILTPAEQMKKKRRQ
ncbi:MAG: hypothetical protein GVY36_13340 [Verrucomicrobia bacterium]|jgi:hypothetical protein|nr:hypothetical protein [Verrucomicrobiota bacterium]